MFLLCVVCIACPQSHSGRRVGSEFGPYVYKGPIWWQLFEATNKVEGGEREKIFLLPPSAHPPPTPPSPPNNTNQSVQQTAAYKLESIPIVSLHFSKNSRTPIKPPGFRSRDRYALSSFFGRCLFELFTFSHPGKGKGFFHR